MSRGLGDCSVSVYGAYGLSIEDLGFEDTGLFI